MPNDISFIVPGQVQRASPAAQALRGEVKASVRVGARRGAGDSVRLTARPGEDVVVLSIANGPTLVLHPEAARDLMRAQGSAVAGKRGASDAPAPGDAVAVPAQLGWPGLETGAAMGENRGATRGWMGQVLLSAVDIVKGLVIDHGVDIVSALATRKLDGRVDSGVYELSANELLPLKGSGRKRDSVPAAADGGPLLVLVHGTFVDSVSTFGKLWALYPQVVGRLFAHYANRVYALDHPTMAQSPITNALTLVRAMPQGAKLHLVTHSRGGVVAEVLARACGGGALSDADLALFADVPAAPGAKTRDYTQHRQDLQALVSEAQAKGLQVERMLRVACPARGTLLASKRLDAYLSVLKWGLELAGVPVVPELMEFLSEVAQRRTDPMELPGLEAMTPDSPVVQWLNRGGEPIPGQLRVLAGDIEGDSLMSWVKTLLSDAFYWTDNDLVVQTRSMYGGAARVQSGASFVLDRGAKVSHFNYFSNERSVAAMASGLLDDQPADFKIIGPLSWAGQDSSGTRAAHAIARSRGADSAGVPAEQRPAVIVLPGILGSNIALDGKRIWLGLRLIGGLKRLAWDPATASHVTPDGPIGMVYDDLVEHLSATHEVIEFAYDWRRPVEDEARRLATVVDAALTRRDASQQPVRLVAHSMGGLVARTMQLECPEVWDRLMARSGARLLMLGTPNGGSWAPMQTLSGDDTFGNTLVAFGGLFDDAGTREVMAAMPGFIQLQADLLDRTLDLQNAATWTKLANDDYERLRQRSIWHADERQISVYRWSAPPQAVLDQAVALRRRLDEQAAKLGADAQKMLLVVGHAKFTPAGYRLSDEGLEYLDATDGGDGRVTLASALLPGVRTWRCDAEHGKLPSESSAFAAYVELLSSGDTQGLPRLESSSGGTRGAGRNGGSADDAAPALVPNRPSRGRRNSEPPSLASDLFARQARTVAAAQSARLPVCVVNGNLKFVNQPLLLGHYVSATLSGAEHVVNGLIGGAMNESLGAGLYPAGIGTHQVFANTRADPEQPLAMPRPLAVVVVGLGEEGRLRLSDLTSSVRQGVMAYAQRESEQRGGGATGFELAATLIGSGGLGVHVGGAARAIAQGVIEANQRLRRNGWPVVTLLRLVELYLDRATEAHNALAVLAESRPNDFALAASIVPGIGPLRRPADSGYRGAAYDFITAVQRLDEHQRPMIEYTLDTQRARNEVRGQATQAQLVDELVRIGADSDNTDVQIGRSLFQLLVPVEIEPFLSGSTAIVLQLDQDTARFPWELLDTGPSGQAAGSERLPWAVRTQVLRKLRTEEFRAHSVAAGREGGVLVIGEPQCDKTRFAELPGARQEAQAVAQALGAQPLLGPDALQAVNALLARPLRIVHISGHGEHRDDGTGGVVLSNDTLLGPREIGAMRCVPELVFINCCFIGQIHADPAVQRNALGAQRARFAASVSEQLIRDGVRCVVAAGWAVEDGPAMQFAMRFYQSLLAGERFIDAVGAARLAAWEAHPAGNTWAAYQCYGDPDWRYVPPDEDQAQQAAAVPEVASAPSLALALENEALEARYASVRSKDISRKRLDKLRQLQARYQSLWGGIGAVAEAFGLAYAECGDIDAAIDWYQRAVRAADGSASMKAAEQLGNQMARRGAEREDAAQARTEIGAAIKQLQQLTDMQATAERENLLGSAWKRLAMVEQGEAATAALQAAALHYSRAEGLARDAVADDLFYPIMNGIAAQLRVAALRGQPMVELDAGRVAAARQSLQAKLSQAPDFWSVAGLLELRMLEALSQRNLAGARAGIEQGFADLAQRAPAKRMWASVRDQALFTLLPYSQSVQGAEAAAATALLKQLKALAD
jgi:CHAT domain-containing protein/pimeloyl-ACP methyl ester carboxylesterase